MKPRTLAVLLALALGTVWALGRSTSVQSERQAIAEQAQANAQVAHKAYREARKAVAPALAQTDTVTRLVKVQDAALGSQLDAARAVLASTEHNEYVLRETLAATVVQAETFRVAVDSLTKVHAAERVILLNALSSSETALEAQTRATEAWRTAAKPLPWYKQTARTLCIGGVGAGSAGAGAAIADVQGAAIGALVGVVVGAVACR